MTTRKIALALLLSVYVAACGRSKPETPVTPPGGGKKVDQTSAGSISGTVSFVGTPPAIEMLKMSGDPACAQVAGPNPQSDAVLVGKDGAVQNAFVFIQDGLDPSYSFDLPGKAAEIDQKGCRYVPRVLGIRAGQSLDVVNGDATVHNVHPIPVVKGNPESNRPQPLQGQRSSFLFNSPEVMVRIKCDVHGWMAAYVGVMAHPFFAVTAADGSFELKGVPPGTYTIEAWHEKFGTRSARLTLDAQGAQKISIRFGPA